MKNIGVSRERFFMVATEQEFIGCNKLIENQREGSIDCLIMLSTQIFVVLQGVVNAGPTYASGGWDCQVACGIHENNNTIAIIE